MNDGEGASATLIALLVVAALAAIVVVPALVYLLWLIQQGNWAVDSDHIPPADEPDEPLGHGSGTPPGTAERPADI